MPLGAPAAGHLHRRRRPLNRSLGGAAPNASRRPAVEAGMRSRHLLAGALTLCVAACGHRVPPSTPDGPSHVHVVFTAQSDSFAAARDAYEALWRAEGPRIVHTMEHVAGIRFDSPPYADTL